MSFTAVKGMHDLLPPVSVAWTAVEAIARRVAARYGFGEVRTPIVEKTALFVRGIGEASAIVEKEMYVFADQGDEQLALRPEGTAPVVRAYIESGAFQTDPLAKYFYLGPMFRRERPQKGRYRQFAQFGVEVIGAAAPAADIEVIALLMRFLGDAGLAKLRLEINSLGCAICRPAYLQVLQRMLEKMRSELCADCQRRSEKNPLRIFDCKNPQCRHLVEDLPTIVEYWCPACTAHFQAVRVGLDQLQIGHVLNPRIARGLDYYVRTAFEVTAEGLGAQNAVGGGGRYDGLVKALGGPEVPGVGFAVGLERLLLLTELPRPPITPELRFFAAIGEKARAAALPLIEHLRSAGIAMEWDYEDRSLKSQMRRADKLGAARVVILGADEWKKQKAIVRDMRTKEQTEVPFKELAHALTRT